VMSRSCDELTGSRIRTGWVVNFALSIWLLAPSNLHSSLSFPGVLNVFNGIVTIYVYRLPVEFER